MAEVIYVDKDVELDEVILKYLRENGFEHLACENLPLVRKFDAKRLESVIKNGTDRDSSSSWCGQHHYPIIKELGLKPEDVIFAKSGIKGRRLGEGQAYSVYNPDKLKYVPAEGYMYTVCDGATFLDALIVVFSTRRSETAAERTVQ